MQLGNVALLEYLLCLNDNLWLWNGSFILPLQVLGTLFSAMVLLLQICKLCCWLDRSLPLSILIFFCNCIMVLVTWLRFDFFIMSLDDFWDIVHATVADFNIISVENSVKLMASWEMFCYQLKECLCNVCWNGFAKGWVKPYYDLLSRFWFFWFVVGVFQINIITRFV